jgi:hypothetical protein
MGIYTDRRVMQYLDSTADFINPGRKQHHKRQNNALVSAAAFESIIFRIKNMLNK